MTITALPTPPARTDAPATFVSRADAFLGALPAFGTEANALATQLNAMVGAVTSGTAITIQYTIDANVQTDSDPGAGVLRFNQATQDTSTYLYPDLQSSVAGGSIDVTGWLDVMAGSTSTIKGYLRIYKTSTPANYLLFSISDWTTKTGYRRLGVTKVASSAASPFAHSDAVTMVYTRNGDAATFSGDLANTDLAGIRVATFYQNKSDTWGATTDVSFALAQLHRITASTSVAATTINITAPPPGSKCCHLQIQIAASANANTYSWSGATVKWVGGTWSGTVVNKETFINLFFDGTTYWAQGTNEV